MLKTKEETAEEFYNSLVEMFHFIKMCNITN